MKSWIMTHSGRPLRDHTITGSTLSEAITRYFEKTYWVWDCDNCGVDEYEIRVLDEGIVRHFRMIHSYYVETDPEWDISNSFELEEITSTPGIHNPGRNWIIV